MLAHKEIQQRSEAPEGRPDGRGHGMRIDTGGRVATIAFDREDRSHSRAHDAIRALCTGKRVVVLAGAVDGLIKSAVRPILQYAWDGDLSIAKLTLSSFTRQGVKASRLYADISPSQRFPNVRGDLGC